MTLYIYIYKYKMTAALIALRHLVQIREVLD